ncbi:MULTISPECIES: type 1 glutamine amidotransferase domain-containing protein [Paenibacillus]|uniref:type 1 glutamine amidotransferase domain-containing protein n=1 Tax=Paenibacillus TaxID=44249 RepID=UPI0001AFD3FA|nr:MULTISPECIES: type 1 glutamine amidotransferase domain-containing protein [unclassified Paenibacillus]EES74465.1 DJ-1/PfpI family protein [Paenibacillus sp. oral taxon 786 str. D14]MCT2194746.1 type 1 glutamine amidotransferase domain-containing protein [Paenibacillus sp. p3-SID1389]
MNKKILIVVTNHSDIHEGRKTGIWLSEFAEAYQEFIQQGYQVTVASPLGGRSPVDPNSVNEETPREILESAKQLENTVPIHAVTVSDFDAIFLPGGHGTMYDLPENQHLHELIRDFYEAGKIVAAVCHGPAGLTGVRLSNGLPLVAGKRVNAFTNGEEAQTGLDNVLPFLLESRLRELGAIFRAAPNWTSHHEVDGNLITGQNPQSTLAVTKAVIEKLG